MSASCERVGRSPEEVHLVAVTKYVSVDTAIAAIEQGVRHIGENRAEGLLEKQAIIGRDKVTWHFIGSLQSRKVKDVIDHIDYLHSLDRLSLAQEINKRATQKVKCFVQVNVSGEDSKHGVPPEKVEAFVEQLADFTNIQVIGLMTMAPHIEDEGALRTVFSELKTIQTKLAAREWPYAPCTELSMGMSNDFELAIEEGATFIRVGTALVGKDL